MALSYQLDEITLFPFKKELGSTSWSTFKQDISSGMSVALLTLPQALAYSMLAGLPLYCGLASAIYASLMAALFGSSRHLIVGPSSAIAILVQYGTSEVLYNFYRNLDGFEREVAAVQILTQLCLLVGVIQLLAALCKLGRLTQFVSHSVVVGYVAGTAIAVIVNQLYDCLGIPRAPGVNSIYERALFLITHITDLHIPTAFIGLGSVILLIVLKKLDKRLPAAVLTFVLMGSIVYIFDLSTYSVELSEADSAVDTRVQKIMLVADSSAFFDLVPHFVSPFFDSRIMNNLIPVAVAVALLSVLETISVTKSIAASSGQRLSINQEIFGISIGNLFASFIGALPISGSTSRTSMNLQNGAQTRLAAIVNSLGVAFILLTLGDMVQLIPIAALSALLLYSAFYIINAKQFLLCSKATSSDALVLWVTVLACLFFNLDIAFYIGVSISITLYLKKAAVPVLNEYDFDEKGELISLDYTSHSAHKSIRVIKVEGELFFGAADVFQSTLKAFAEDDNHTRVIVLQLKNARDIDATACMALQHLYEYLKKSNRHLIACGITQPIWDVLSDSGLVEEIGKENLIFFDEKHPHQFMSKALYRAKTLIAQDLEAEAKLKALAEKPAEEIEAPENEGLLPLTAQDHIS